MKLPEFIEGVQYRQLSPEEGKGIYRFVTKERLCLEVEDPFIAGSIPMCFYDKSGKLWMIFHKNQIIIEPGYAWNGCSPKKYTKLFGWMGTPDMKPTILASLFHDALLQFLEVPYYPLCRSDCDKIFTSILKEQKFKLTFAYSLGVSFGTIFDIGGPEKGCYAKIAIDNYNFTPK